MTESAVVQSNPEEVPIYFAVSTTKLVVLWFCSLGFYGIYWFYMQWRHIKQHEKSDIMPAARSIFQIFFIHSLIQHVNATAKTERIEDQLSAGMLATGYIILSIMGSFREPLWLVSFLSIAFLVPIQKVINRININQIPNASLNDSYSGANVTLIVIGGLLFVLAFIGAFTPKHFH
jgi:hypothetical protein